MKSLTTPALALLAAATWLLTPLSSVAQDISDPRRLIFVADSEDPIIDVIDVGENAAIYRIETSKTVDDLVAPQNAPILIYTNIAAREVTFYDLQNKTEALTVELSIAPRHIVLSPTGNRLAVTDSVDGGFVLLSAYSGSIVFELPEFAPSSDVLFDPNDVDVYFSNSRDGTIGFVDTNTQRVFETEVAEAGSVLSSPSRSLDARYIYVANESSGEVYSLNAFSRVVFKTFHIGNSPVRPYTTPEGSFLYMVDRSGRFVSIEQFEFAQIVDAPVIADADLIAVGRFDRLNLFASTEHNEFEIFDNARLASVRSGSFDHTPVDVAGSADGRLAYIAFSDAPRVAVYNLERQQIEYIDATVNGVAAMSLGLSNNVCH